MAEVLLFDIPQVAVSDPILNLLWFQSLDGLVWDLTPVDTILFAALPIDSSSGKFSWSSSLADPLKFHQLKIETVSHFINDIGFIIEPRPSFIDDNAKYSAGSTKIVDGTDNYQVGESIELMLELDNDLRSLVGEVVSILILDPFGNVLDTASATLVGGGIYSAEYRIPKNLESIYNKLKVDESANDPNYFVLTDRWLLTSTATLDFGFRVKRKSLEPAVTNNAAIEIKLSGITSFDSIVMEDYTLKFSTHMIPFYCTVDDVRGTNKEFIQSFDNFEVANEILVYSQEVDYTLAPIQIKRQETFDYACTQYVAYSTAYSLISAGAFNNLSEDKEIDTFKVSVTRNEKANVLKHMLEYIATYNDIIQAGGLDNLFQAATFIKGLFDPNRTNISRASMDNSDSLPYLNKTTQSFAVTNQDGSSYEVRGTHTVGYLGFRNNYGMGAGSYNNPQGSSNFIPTEVSYGQAWSHD